MLERGWTVYGVEPNDDMRKEAEKRLSAFPRFHSVAGTAERTGLPGASVDLVTAAQSFHWFDAAAFKRECRRILSGGGKVALIWNSTCCLHFENPSRAGAGRHHAPRVPVPTPREALSGGSTGFLDAHDFMSRSGTQLI